MKAEISQLRFRPDKRYSGVYHEQGRMLTDADLGESVEIAKARLDNVVADIVGDGAPVLDGVVHIGGDDEIAELRPGTIYADGIRGEIHATEDGLGPTEIYDHQEDFPEAPKRPANEAYFLYADLWERPVLSLQDRDLRDPALHGADTSFRTQTMAQIKWCPTSDPAFFDDPAKCPQVGDASLEVVLREGIAAPDPCDPCAEELDLEERVGNYLFRLEIQDVKGDADNPTDLVLLWSSENAGARHRTGDEPETFKTGKHVYEFFNEVTEKHLGVHAPGAANDVRRSEVAPTYPAAPDPDTYPFVRRWDGYCILERNGGGWRIRKDAQGNLVGSDEGAPLIADPGVGHAEITAAGKLDLELARLILTLDLEGKRCVAGDHWLAVVRERAPQEPEDERVKLASQTPIGIVHHYVKLAGVAADGAFLPLSDEERRRLCFPPLTDLPAGHVSFDNNCPQVYGAADTVQEALDALCEREDFEEHLRKHNKYLHGWGVICGAKVACSGEDRKSVEASPGCVVDREGYVIELPKDETVPVTELLDDPDATGEFLLSLFRTEAGEHRYSLDAIGKREAQQSIFEGTLLYRIKEVCLDPLLEALKKLQAKLPAGIRWALLDLLWPVLYRQAERPFVTPEEHGILEALYKVVVEHIKSPTDCELAADVPAFPDYPFANEPRIHGVPLKWPAPKMRVQPGGKLVYAFGGDRTAIQIIDAGKMTVTDTIELKKFDEKALSIIDVAPDADGRMVAIAATALDDSRTHYRIYRYDLETEKVTAWSKTGDRIVEVRLGPRPDGPLYVLLREAGVFSLARNDSDLKPIVTHGPKLIDNLIISPKGDAGYAHGQMTEAKEIFHFIVGFPLLPNRGPFLQVPLEKFVPESVLVIDFGETRGIVIAGGPDSPAGEKFLRVYQAKGESSKLHFEVGLGEGEVNLARFAVEGRDFAFLSRGQVSSVSGLWWFDVENVKQEWDPSRYLTAQLEPGPIEATGDQVFILNKTSQSVLKVPVKLPLRMENAGDTNAFREPVETYRAAAVLAFLVWARLWLRAFRDCLCHQLLPDCPVSGDPPHLVPLAAITLKEGVVKRICNIGHRKYAVTFPNLFYWLSLIPIIPWILWKLHEFCCAARVPGFEDILPDDKEVIADEPPAPAEPVWPTAGLMPNTFLERTVRFRGEKTGLGRAFQGLAYAAPILAMNPKLGDVAKMAPTMVSRITGARVLEVASAAVEGQIFTAGAAVPEVTGKPPEEAERLLEAYNIKIDKQVALEDAEVPADAKIVDAVLTPLLVKAGDKVDLYTRDGKVAFYTVSRPVEPRLVAQIKKELPKVKAEIDVLEERKADIADFSAVNEAIATVEARRVALAELGDVEGEIEALKTEKGTITEEVEALREKLTGLEEDRAAIADVGPVRVALEELEAKRRAIEDVAALESEIAALEEKRAAIEDTTVVRDELAALEARRARLVEESTRLNDTVEELGNTHKELALRFRRVRPIRDVVEDPEVDVFLGRMNITTLGDLADVEDPRNLVVAGGPLNVTAARRLIAEAKRRIKRA